MFDKTAIESALFGLVGWNQPFDTQYAILEPDLLVSRSGYKVDENPYSQVQNFRETISPRDISDADFNELLRINMRSAVADVCNAVFDEPAYIDRQVLYRFPINKVETDDLPAGFVGHKIQVDSTKNLAFEIKRVLFDFDVTAGTDTIRLLLWSSEKKAPIFTQDILIDSDRVETQLNWVLNNTGGIYKGEFYLGYLTQGLVNIKPYKREYNGSNIESCITSMYVQPVKVDGHTSDTELFDLEDTDGISEAIGINPDITVYDDFTDLITQNERLFARAIQISSQIKIISNYAASLRSNKDQRMSKDMHIKIMAQLEGTQGDDIIKITGLRTLLHGELIKVGKEIKKLRNGYSSEGMITVTTLC